MRKILLLLLTLSALIQNSNAQQITRNSVVATRTSSSIKIDGQLDDDAWKAASKITGLVEMRPTFNKQEDQATRSEIFFLYDDEAVYVAGMLYENSAAQISTELAGRDNVGAND